MAIKREKVIKGKNLSPLLIKPEGSLGDIEFKAPVFCLLDYFDNCFGCCEWLSIDEAGIAKCRNTPIGKITAPEKKS